MPAPLPSAAGLGRFLAELKRRKVYRTTAAYAAGAFASARERLEILGRRPRVGVR